MHDHPAALEREIDHALKAFPQGIDDEALLNGLFDVLHDDRVDERRQILKVIVEGIAVDPAVLDDVLDGDLVDRPLLQQTEAGIHNGLARKGSHDVFFSSPFFRMPRAIVHHS